MIRWKPTSTNNFRLHHSFTLAHWMQPEWRKPQRKHCCVVAQGASKIRVQPLRVDRILQVACNQCKHSTEFYSTDPFVCAVFTRFWFFILLCFATVELAKTAVGERAVCASNVMIHERRIVTNQTYFFPSLFSFVSSLLFVFLFVLILKQSH